MSDTPKVSAERHMELRSAKVMNEKMGGYLASIQKAKQVLSFIPENFFSEDLKTQIKEGYPQKGLDIDKAAAALGVSVDELITLEALGAQTQAFGLDELLERTVQEYLVYDIKEAFAGDVPTFEEIGLDPELLKPQPGDQAAMLKIMGKRLMQGFQAGRQYQADADDTSAQT